MQRSDFNRMILSAQNSPLRAEGIDRIQVNVGLRCNQNCAHCHLRASPLHKEMMQWSVMQSVISIIERINCKTVDITGGAPELNPELPRFINQLRQRNITVILRSNLTVLIEDKHSHLIDFFRENQVQIVASLPCYLEENVEAQRGAQTYQKSIAALRKLNEAGYGIDPGLGLDLVYNPGGTYLPAAQNELEQAYKKELSRRHGIRFNRLYTITNVPIGRFAERVEQSGEKSAYFGLLQRSFNQLTVAGLMCRRQLSVGWDGTLYDCDFNLALGLPVDGGAPDKITEFDFDKLARREIVTGSHCYACTAGCGSSCGGSLVKDRSTTIEGQS